MPRPLPLNKLPAQVRAHLIANFEEIADAEDRPQTYAHLRALSPVMPTLDVPEGKWFMPVVNQHALMAEEPSPSPCTMRVRLCLLTTSW